MTWRAVSPYRPFAPESASHRALGAFDWPRALGWLAASVRQSCGVETVVLTDEVTALPVPAFRFPTAEPRLMLWILEVSLAYLASPHFDRDTVLLSPDTMVRGDLSGYFGGDLSLLVRSHPKYARRPLLNAAQWWPAASRDRLIAFYREALAIGRALPDNLMTWGADSESIRRLIAPIDPGMQIRSGLRVRQIEARDVLVSVSPRFPAETANIIKVPVVDFKGWRKRLMAEYADRFGVRP